MEYHFYLIRWPPLIVTIFITYLRNLRNGSYANGLVRFFFQIDSP